ncbi:MAG: glycosyltransferase family 1 protein, partial [Planctomycetaceae bacterium]
IHSAGRPLAYPSADELPNLRATMNLPQRYLLHLGTLEPRKNIGVLLDAMSAIPPAIRKTCPLVLAGGLGWGGAEFWRSLANHPMASEVLWAGFVDDASAAAMLAGAQAVLSPSFYEGFGLPLLEAMNAGTAVICSTADAFTEVAGPAAHFVDPTDTAGWSVAICQVIEDAAWRNNLAESGKIRAREFSWDSCAKAHAEVFEKIGRE